MWLLMLLAEVSGVAGWHYVTMIVWLDELYEASMLWTGLAISESKCCTTFQEQPCNMRTPLNHELGFKLEHTRDCMLHSIANRACIPNHFWSVHQVSKARMLHWWEPRDR